MLTDEEDLAFICRATTELAGSFTDARDHNLHAALNGLIKAIQTDRKRIQTLEDEVKFLRSTNPAITQGVLPSSA